MYNAEKLVGAIDTTVSALIEELKKLPPDAKIAICGDSYCFIHVETDNSVVCIDNEMLDECYENLLEIKEINTSFKNATAVSMERDMK